MGIRVTITGHPLCPSSGTDLAPAAAGAAASFAGAILPRRDLLRQSVRADRLGVVAPKFVTASTVFFSGTCACRARLRACAELRPHGTCHVPSTAPTALVPTASAAAPCRLRAQACPPEIDGAHHTSGAQEHRQQAAAFPRACPGGRSSSGVLRGELCRGCRGCSAWTPGDWHAHLRASPGGPGLRCRCAWLPTVPSYSGERLRQQQQRVGWAASASSAFTQVRAGHRNEPPVGPCRARHCCRRPAAGAAQQTCSRRHRRRGCRAGSAAVPAPRRRPAPARRIPARAKDGRWVFWLRPLRGEALATSPL